MVKPFKDGTWLGAEMEALINEAQKNQYWYEFRLGPGTVRIIEPEESKNRFRHGEVYLLETPLYKGHLRYVVEGKEQALADFVALRASLQEHELDFTQLVKAQQKDFAHAFCYVTDIGRLLHEEDRSLAMSFGVEIKPDDPIVKFEGDELVFIVIQIRRPAKQKLLEIRWSMKDLIHREILLGEQSDE